MTTLSRHKEPFKIIRKWADDNGVAHVEYEASFWVDGLDDDGKGNFIFGPQGYQRKRSIVSATDWRNKVSRNVSFFDALAKALGIKETRAERVVQEHDY